VPPQFGRAPAPVPLAAILNVEYCLVDRVILGERETEDWGRGRREGRSIQG
jgi:hypothetical protein